MMVKNLTQNLIKRLLITATLATLILPQTSLAADIEAIWDPVTLDTEGIVIPAEFITYKLYEENAGLLVTTDETSAMYTNVPIGCYKFWVTAYRSDSDLESVPSNSVEKCITEDTDDTIRLLIPRAPAITIQLKLGQG